MILGSAIATLLLFAGNEIEPPSPDALSEDWSGLDRELERRVAATLVERRTSGPRVTGRFQLVTRATSGEFYETGAGDDQLAVDVDQLQIGMRGRVGQFSYLFRMQGGGGTLVLQAARVRWHPSEDLSLSFGNTRLPLIHSRNVPRPHVMFVERSRQARNLRRRDPAVEFAYTRPRWRAYGGVHNGGDGAGDELLFVGRIEGNVLGNGPFRHEYSPAIDAPTRLVVGFAVADEGTLDDGLILIGDVAFVSGRLYLHGEVVDYGRDFTVDAVPDGAVSAASGAGGTTPLGATVGWRFTELWDAGARFEWLDDPDRTWDLTLGVNRAVPVIEARWQADWTLTESDASALTGQRFALGLFWSI